jgi:hypothetical protein
LKKIKKSPSPRLPKHHAHAATVNAGCCNAASEESCHRRGHAGAARYDPELKLLPHSPKPQEKPATRFRKPASYL